jgi:hypothetical protein
VIEQGDAAQREALLQAFLEEIRVVKPGRDLPLLLFARGSTTVRVSAPSGIRTRATALKGL